MNFELLESQVEVAGLAAKIFAQHAAGDGDLLWATLAGAGLVGTAVPEELGGAGHGVLEWCALLAAAGAAGTQAPVWAVTLGAWALGDDEVVRDVVRGTSAVTVALLDEVPVVERDGHLHGVKTCVPATRAPWYVVTAGERVYRVAKKDVRIEAQTATTGEPVGRVTFDGAPAKLLAVTARELEERGTVGLCALELGLTEQVLRMTAKYTSERVQFDRPIATFQAVAQRAADAYIDVETIRLTLWEAAWRLSAGLPAAREIAIAKFFAAEAGQRVTYAAQHLHGGLGFDLDYPLAKYYPLSKWIELTLGGANAQLARLGELITHAG